VSSSVIVRPFEERDSAACRALWTELTGWHRELYDDPSIGGDDPGSSFDRYVEEFADARLWVAEHSGSVTGFAGLIVRGNQAEVEPVVVTADARGEGVGRMLVATAVEAARADGIGQIKVSPVARNAEAIRFFHQIGFTALGHVELLADFRRPDGYWRPGERIADRDFDV
jgi:N-acetylglutamate synthase-like GNAT family acetyltransferase